MIALESGAPTGLRGLLGGAKGDTSYHAEGGTVGVLEAAGFRPVRTLGDRQGYRFIEGLKAYDPRRGPLAVTTGHSGDDRGRGRPEPALTTDLA
jgi:hypothetical protein